MPKRDASRASELQKARPRRLHQARALWNVARGPGLRRLDLPAGAGRAPGTTVHLLRLGSWRRRSWERVAVANRI